ncbi:organic solvent tolerance protein [Candidatus Pelagibacter sp.]|nr:organic solvent tolerance protein [Candidatus Pelagibacter sp.]
MKSKFLNSFFLLIWFFFSFCYVNADEAFTFNVAEIEILENGNRINGTNGGTVISDDGSTITGKNFFYNKQTNILEITENVKYSDNTKNIKITADKAIYYKNDEKIFTIGNSKVIGENNNISANELEYDKNLNTFKAEKNAEIDDYSKDTKIFADEISYIKDEEKIFTKGETKALVQKKYKFNSSDIDYSRNNENIFSKKKTSIEDDSGNVYKLNGFSYNIAEGLLKGKEVEVLAKVAENKIDRYFFEDGFFNFKTKNHIAKKTKINIHKDVFGDKNNDPRIYSSSSISDQNKTVFNNAIFTSCKFNDDCPPWSLKAEKITHDKIKKDMIYKNAILKVYDVPVLYFPKFFHPDSTVERRSGFLQPRLNNSKTLGSSINIPYFKTLGSNKDLTFKPTFFEKFSKFEREKYILQTEFRKKEKNSSLIADFAFLRDYKSSINSKTKNINHLFLNYNSDLNFTDFLESKFEARIERVSNDTYLKVFENNLFETPLTPESQTTLKSNLNLYLDKGDKNLTTGIEVYENLGVKHSDRYQYTLPYYDFYQNISSMIADYPIDGSLNFYSTGINKLSNTNNLRTTVVNDIVFNSKDFISNLGFKNDFDLYLKNLNSAGKKDPLYSSNIQMDGMSILKFDSALPLSKSTNINRQTLTPKISLRINPGNNMDNYSTSATNITANNVYDINRLGISDVFEAGRSLTFGFDYKFDPLEKDISENTKDKYFEVKLATVARDEFENDIPISSTINRKNSDIFGSINNRLFNNLNLTYDFSLDNDLKTINSHSISTDISINNFVTSFNYIEKRNEVGSIHMLSNVTEYIVNDNTSLKFSTRRNKEINLTEYYDLSYEYKNDCLTAALKFKKTFYQDNDLKPTEDLFFSITLVPLATYETGIKR